MKAKEKIIPAFLTGGGKMGELIRSFDWSKTAVGSPGTWPQSLRIAVRIMLDTPFGMYIAWGDEYIQLYNDGYRPILGATKHPQALGLSSRTTFTEIWPTIGPMFEGVMQGTPVGFPDFTLQLDRNGFLEECVFDFSYSPIRLEDGEVGGVLVTVIETTEKVKAAKALKESEEELQFAIEATELGIWDLNPATNKFRGNSRLNEWFGLKPNEEIELPLALAVIADKDRDKVTDAIQTTLQFSSGGQYDITYTIIHPQTKNERIVRAMGRATFNAEGIAYRLNGTLQDVTEEIVARRLLTESEQLLSNERMVLYNSFMNAPAAIAILKGDTHIYEFANAEYEKIVDRKITIGKTVQELFPEVEQQGLIDILNNVFSTGQPFIANEFPVELINKRTGKLVLGYYNSVLQPIKDEKGNTERLLSHGVEVTQQVEARKQIEASEKRFRLLAEALPQLVWMTNEKGEYEYASRQWMEYSGLNPHKEESWALLVHADDMQAMMKTWEKSLSSGQTYVSEARLKDKKGEYRWHVVHGEAIKNEKGEVVKWIGAFTDIHEQQVIEEALRESSENFRQLADLLPQIIWTSRPDGFLDYYNKRWYEFTGLEEGYGDQSWLPILHPDDVQLCMDTWNHSVQSGEAYAIEYRFKDRIKGGFRWFLGKALPIKDKEGNILKWFGTCTDINDQKSFTKELENKVKERTEQLQLQNHIFGLAESIAQFGSYSWSITTGTLEYSDNLFRLLDCEPQEFVPSFEKFLSFIHPDDLQQVIENGKQTTKTGALVETPYRIISKTGKTKWFRSSGSFSGEGANRLLIGTVQDISKDVVAAEALIEKEDYLNQIINNAPDAVIVVNEKNIITLWNPKTEEIFGWKAEEVLGLNLSDTIIPPQYREGHREGMIRLLKTGEPRILNKPLELAALNKEGKEFPISLTVSQAVQQGDKLFISFIRDITLEKRTKDLAISNQSLLKANIELEASQKASEELLKQRDEFISIASHEMKTPLTTAKGYTELLLLSLSEETESVLYATKANQAVERLHDLVTELLDASKIQNGKLNYNITTFDFNKMVDETIEIIHLSAKNHLIQKTGDCSQQITGDRGRLQQVLINLLSNAVKYSPKADRVLVRIEVQDSKIQVSVQDFGVGMSVQHLDKIFDRYYRVEEHAIHFQGLGIGLYISNNIIERHEGKMWAESEPGKGSTFYFTLPL